MPDVLPAITLDVEPTPPGLQEMSSRLAAFARERDLPEDVAARLVAVATDAADVLTDSVGEPPLERLQADADIGDENAQLVLIASDQRLLDLYGSVKGRFESIAARCDDFDTQLMPTTELQVWACFVLGP